MGWLWSSPAAPASTPAESRNEKINPLASSIQEPPTATQQASSSKTSPGEKTTGNEWDAFLAEIEADSQRSNTKYQRLPKQAPNPTIPPKAPGDEAISEQILPTTMSCRDAFDSAFYCNSMGGQFNNLYRYGKMRECSENWNDFWFCMRVRTWGEDSKAEAIKNRYREKERLKYGQMKVEDGENVGRSSEDIWKSRDKMVEPGTEFQEPPPGPFSGSDAEWNEQERRRRKAVAETYKS